MINPVIDLYHYRALPIVSLLPSSEPQSRLLARSELSHHFRSRVARTHSIHELARS